MNVVALPDNQHALSGSGDKTVQLFNANDGAVLRTFTHHTDPVFSWHCCPTASALSAARTTTQPASPTTASRRKNRAVNSND